MCGDATPRTEIKLVKRDVTSGEWEYEGEPYVNRTICNTPARHTIQIVELEGEGHSVTSELSFPVNTTHYV